MKKFLVFILMILMCESAFAVDKDDFWYEKIENSKRGIRAGIASGDVTISFGAGGYFIDRSGGWERPEGFAELSAINELCTDEETKSICYDSQAARYQYELQEIHRILREIKK